MTLDTLRIDIIWLDLNLFVDAAQMGFWDSAALLIESSQCCNSLVKSSAWLWSHLAMVTSNTNLYSSISIVSRLSHSLTSTLLAVIVCILAFPVRVAVIHLYAQAESVKIVQHCCFPYQ